MCVFSLAFRPFFLSSFFFVVVTDSCSHCTCIRIYLSFLLLAFSHVEFKKNVDACSQLGRLLRIIH